MSSSLFAPNTDRACRVLSIVILLVNLATSCAHHAVSRRPTLPLDELESFTQLEKGVERAFASDDPELRNEGNRLANEAIHRFQRSDSVERLWALWLREGFGGDDATADVQFERLGNRLKSFLRFLKEYPDSPYAAPILEAVLPPLSRALRKQTHLRLGYDLIQTAEEKRNVLKLNERSLQGRIYYCLSLIHLAWNELDPGLNAIHKAIQAAPSEAEYILQRGRLKLAQFGPKSALRDVLKAAALDESIPDLLPYFEAVHGFASSEERLEISFRMGRLLSRLTARRAKARRAFQEVIAESPDSKWAKLAEKELEALEYALDWVSDLDQAKSLSRRMGKPIFILLVTEWSTASRQFELSVLSDTDIQRRLSKNFVLARIDAGRFPAVSRAFEVFHYPSVVILSVETAASKRESSEYEYKAERPTKEDLKTALEGFTNE